jgi:hypothetical protein
MLTEIKLLYHQFCGFPVCDNSPSRVHCSHVTNIVDFILSFYVDSTEVTIIINCVIDEQHRL